MRKIKLLLLFLTCTLLSFQGNSQDMTVTGKITDEQGEPIIGASVIVKGTTRGSITDLEGNFSLRASRGEVLEVSFIGYAAQELEVTGESLSVSLREDITNLEEVIISGLASTVKRSNLANSVASISGKELSETTNQQTMDAALYGKFKGVNITSNSGAPGGGISVKLRGITSINGSNEPLYIIDGVYLDNSAISGGLNTVSKASGGGNQSNQDNPTNRIADIDPEDIEFVEILKGASAAAMYGSRASGGVIIITTKRGTSGKPKINFSQTVGISKILKPLGVREWDATKVETHFGVDEVANFQAAKSAGKLYDYEQDLYGNTGSQRTSRITLSGGNESTGYFVGATVKKDQGIVPNTGYSKNAFRLNLDHKLSDRIKLTTSTNYVKSSADRGFFNNDNSGTTMGIAFVATPAWAELHPDENGNYPNNPYAASNFLQTANLVTNNESVSRLISGATLTANLMQRDKSNLQLMVRGGLDNYTLETRAIFPNTLQFQKDGNGTGGASIQGTTTSANTNLAAFLIHDYYASPALTFRTQLGTTAENFNRNNIIGTATFLNGSQTNLDQSGSVAVSQSRLLQNDRGIFFQEEVNYNDMIIGTAGVRADKSSNNGDPNKLYYYPKGSVAINLHQMTDLSSAGISQLKLRTAYGQAGNFAVFGDKWSSLNPINIDGSAGLVISNTIGNENIKPERQSELEFGFDAGVLENKVALDFTYYIKSVDDLLLRAEVPTSTGQTVKVVNAASLENKGIEIGLNLNLINTEDFRWSSRTSLWQNRGLITRLDIPSYTTGGFADFLGQFRIKEGHSPTEIIGVGPADQQDEDGLVIFGNAEPNFQMSFMNNLSFKGFEFTMLWHWKNGGKNINLSALLSDLSGTSPDYDRIDLDPDSALGNGDYRLSQLGANSGPYIENAGYLRMREAGLFYTIPQSVLGDTFDRIRVGFSGYNLINFFEYRSYDPEVSNFGGKGLSTGVEVTPFPSSKRFNFHLTATF
ncbi:MAG: SusC/RagA family TonB-linked outer membrane protein [Cyclobacteriaceae bacterium]|nr:SusC/RagA family TonB-linked outer membrane protein [Cyclobacteriaceae bacterium]